MIDELLRPKGKDPILKETQIQHEYALKGSIKHHKGHILFSYNYTTNELKRARVTQEVMVGIDSKAKHKRKTHQEKNCLYLQALNEKNAWKKINKMLQAYVEDQKD